MKKIGTCGLGWMDGIGWKENDEYAKYEILRGQSPRKSEISPKDAANIRLIEYFLAFSWGQTLQMSLDNG